MIKSAAYLRRLSTCDERLQRVVHAVAAKMLIAVVTGHRNQLEQDEAVRLRRSKLSWPNSKHNTLPSIAVDLAPLKEDRSIDWNDIAVFHKMARLVLEEAKAQGLKLRWGGDWDRDGKSRHEGDKDERFVDLPHFEIEGA